MRIEHPGVSVKTRTGRLQAVLDDLRRGRVGRSVITKLDRLTRSLGDRSNLIDVLFSKHAGRRLLSVNDSIDTGTASGSVAWTSVSVRNGSDGSRRTDGQRAAG